MAALLLDANLSWRLVQRIQDLFPGSIHVNKAGLGPQPTDAGNSATEDVERLLRQQFLELNAFFADPALAAMEIR